MRDNTSLEVYLDELNKQFKNYLIELDELAQLPNLKNRDYYATERLLQVLIEDFVAQIRFMLKLPKPQKCLSCNRHRSSQIGETI